MAKRQTRKRKAKAKAGKFVRSPQGEIFEIRRGSSRDPLKVQIAVSVKKPKGIRLGKKVLQQALEKKLNSRTFADPRGFKFKIVMWQNPTRNPNKINPQDGNPLNAPRRYGSQHDRWKTLRGPLLQSDVDFRKVRKG